MNLTPLAIKNFIVLCLLVCIPMVGSAQAESGVTIPKLSADITFDGTVIEDTWKGIPKLTMKSHWPEYGNEAVKNTVLKVAYDKNYFYLAAICYEDKENIQESSFRRDANWDLKFDQIAIILDSYNDAENAVMFVVSPSGSRSDHTIRNDAISGSFFNDSWNSFWDAEITTFDGGWQTEIRIPFNILRFDTQNGKTEMGLSVYRYSAHDKVMDTYPMVSNEFGFFSFAKPSLTQKITFQDIENKRPVFFTPFVLGSASNQSLLNDAEDDYYSDRNTELSAGFSAQYAISNNLNIDVSFNTDFAQVEADNQLVNLTRFSLFFPEKRRFFQERSSTFEFNNDGNNKLFYSRKIGLKSGSIVPLWGGARVVGRSGKMDFGVLNMQSKETSDLASENYGVIRFRRDILNENSFLGGMVTTVNSRGGNYDLGYGVDALINVIGDEYLKLTFAQTSSNFDSVGTGIDRSRVFIEWEKRKNVGFGYKFNFGLVGDQYDPALGFENRSNYWRLGDRLFYNIWMKESSPLQKINLSLNGNTFVNRTTDKIESASINPSMYIAGKNEFEVDLGFNAFFDHPLDTFNLSDDVYVVPGQYWNNTVNMGYTTPRINLYTFSFGHTIGGFYDGKINSSYFGFGYVPNKYLQLDVESEYNNIRIPEFKTYESFVSRFIVTVSLDVKWTISSFAQYNSAQDLWALNSKIRFNPRDGTNLYIVYNGNYNTNIQNSVPRLPQTESSLFVVKYSRTFFL